MTEAIFGFVGVVVGGVITWVIEVWRARRADSDTARAAALLVADELATIDNRRTVNERQWKRQQDLAMEQDAWITHRAVLARELESNHWRNVRRAYDALASPQESSAGERYVNEAYAAAMAALEPLIMRERYWWRRFASGSDRRSVHVLGVAAVAALIGGVFAVVSEGWTSWWLVVLIPAACLVALNALALCVRRR